MAPLSTAAARIIFDAIPPATLNNPPDVATATAYAQLAQNAGRPITPGCAALLPDGATELQSRRALLSPGGILFRGRLDSNKFISFLWLNMDPGYRIQWPDLTGREQYEWFDCWERAGRTHLRMPDSLRWPRWYRSRPPHDRPTSSSCHGAQPLSRASPSCATPHPRECMDPGCGCCRRCSPALPCLDPRVCRRGGFALGVRYGGVLTSGT